MGSSSGFHIAYSRCSWARLCDIKTADKIKVAHYRKCQTKSGSKHLKDGRKVKFIYQELPEDGAFITAQIAGTEVVYSVVLTNARNPLGREDVERHIKRELSGKEYPLRRSHH